MNRPKSMQVYKDMDLKLGIKSSLPKAKSTLALLILLWLSSDKSADLRYSVQDTTKIRLSEECKDNLKGFIQSIDAGLDFDTVLEKVESDIVNIGLHFFHKDVRPMLLPVVRHSTAVV